MILNKNDAVILGGGLIGLTLACFLGKLGLKITIIDKDEVTNNKINEEDHRTTAITAGSKEILTKFGLWQKINKNAEPIKSIKVIDRAPTNKIIFSNPKKNDSLGYIVENKFLKRIFLDEIIASNNITLIEKSLVTNIQIVDNHGLIYTKKKIYNTPLIIAADGKESFVRKILNTAHHALNMRSIDVKKKKKRKNMKT